MSPRGGPDGGGRRGGRALAGALAALALVACESRDWDHTPPPGMGSLVVDNRASDGLHLYVDGVHTQYVDRGDYEIVDLAPGVRRVVLDQAHGSRAWRGDVDVLDGKLTVLDVADGYGPSTYDVRVTFD